MIRGSRWWGWRGRPASATLSPPRLSLLTATAPFFPPLSQAARTTARRRTHASAGPSSSPTSQPPQQQVDLIKAAVALAATLARHADKLGKDASAAAAAAAAASGPPVKPLVTLPNGWALWGDDGPQL